MRNEGIIKTQIPEENISAERDPRKVEDYSLSIFLTPL